MQTAPIATSGSSQEGAAAHLRRRPTSRSGARPGRRLQRRRVRLAAGCATVGSPACLCHHMAQRPRGANQRRPTARPQRRRPPTRLRQVHRRPRRRRPPTRRQIQSRTGLATPVTPGACSTRRDTQDCDVKPRKVRPRMSPPKGAQGASVESAVGPPPGRC